MEKDKGNSWVEPLHEACRTGKALSLPGEEIITGVSSSVESSLEEENESGASSHQKIQKSNSEM
ncbi:hypothetical protein J437_LFUL014256 [Ladona fulva]|uniref:Uncharacterized protein n=1 Tax=Ladona fulva TaxID=123851 RepID=A0A8K0KJY1_LADFU|nr:hypothetical protein J437_LFUL014256 [Ladona fulva]